MMTLFDDEYIFRTYIASKEKEAAEKAAKKAAKKAAEKARNAARKLYEKGNSVEDIAEVFDVSEEEVKQWLDVAAV